MLYSTLGGLPNYNTGPPLTLPDTTSTRVYEKGVNQLSWQHINHNYNYQFGFPHPPNHVSIVLKILNRNTNKYLIGFFLLFGGMLFVVQKSYCGPFRKALKNLEFLRYEISVVQRKRKNISFYALHFSLFQQSSFSLEI